MTLKDDGKDEGAGWQEAEANLGFVRMQWWIFPTYVWTCHIKVGMPLRTKLRGTITPSWAAYTSAEVANEVSDALLDEEEWRGRGGEFCPKLIARMYKKFGAEYTGLGARVEKNQ